MNARNLLILVCLALSGCTGAGDANSVHGDARGGDFNIPVNVTVVQNSGTPMGYTCVSQYGQPMCRGSATPINTSCYCVTPMGTYWGVVR